MTKTLVPSIGNTPISIVNNFWVPLLKQFKLHFIFFSKIFSKFFLENVLVLKKFDFFENFRIKMTPGCSGVLLGALGAQLERKSRNWDVFVENALIGGENPEILVFRSKMPRLGRKSRNLGV